MRLKQWLKKNDMSQGEFSRWIGVRPEQLSAWLTGRKTMGLPRAVQIEDATKGQVPPRVWVKR